MIDKPIRVTVFKRPTRANYEAQWRVPGTDTKKMRSTGHRVKRDAERWAAKLEKELNEGLGGSTRVTWQEFRQRAERDLMPTLRDSTAASYRTTLDKAETYLRPKLVAEIDPEKVGRLADALWKEPGRRGRKKSPASVAGAVRDLKALLNWAFRQGMLPKKPLIDVPRLEVTAKGRPLTNAEFADMLAAVPGVVGNERAPQWSRLLQGLWLSGLRLAEAVALTWDDPEGAHVRLDGRYPMLFIPGRLQKSRKDTVTPITPDFAALLRETPNEERRGFVFDPTPARGADRPSSQWVGKIVGRIGEASGVAVKSDQHPTAHDLRRSFCFRWCQRVLPQQLRQLARHANVTTTLQFYAESDAEMTADALAAAVNRAAGVADKSTDTPSETSI